MCESSELLVVTGIVIGRISGVTGIVILQPTIRHQNQDLAMVVVDLSGAEMKKWLSWSPLEYQDKSILDVRW